MLTTELENAINRWDASDMDELMEPEATLVKAARTLDVLHKGIDPDRLIDAVKFGHYPDSSGEYLLYVARLVKSALGITEDE